MQSFETKSLPQDKDAIAPDGSEVRILLGLEKRGSSAEFRLRPGQVARAVTHKTVHEIWYVLSGEGKIWRSQDGREEISDLKPGVCLTLPLGTRFQFSASATTPLQVFGVTMRPWPNTPDEATVIDGPWKPNV
jgi:mannose-6-phosphate isomerase-like protein (cupin superfamily)